MKPSRIIIISVIVVVLLVALPFYGATALGFAITTGITLIAVLGLQITMGLAGQVNLGQSAFMGVGAYIAGFVVAKTGYGVIPATILGGFGAAVLGLLFGTAAVRIRGFYLALTTIAAQYVFSFGMLKFPAEWFGRAQGLRLPSASLLGFKVDDDKMVYWLVLVISIFALIGATNLRRSRSGLAFIAIRDQEQVAALLGIRVSYHKLWAFLVGTGYAGVAGALWAFYVRYVLVDQFTLWLSIWYAAMLIIGGIRSPWGALVGVLCIESVQQILTQLGPVAADAVGIGASQIIFASMNMVLGLAIILCVIYARDGLFGALRRRLRIANSDRAK